MPQRKGTRPPNKVAPELEEAIVELYAVEGSSRRVAKQFGVAAGTVLRIARERGIARQPNGLTKETALAVLVAYAEGKSGPKVAEEFNTSPTAVYAHWRKSGRICRSISDYDYEENSNHDYFDVIDRPEKAYWLGMLLADGCVSTENEVILALVQITRLSEVH